MMRDEPPPQTQEHMAAAKKITTAKGNMRMTRAVFKITTRITVTRNTERKKRVKRHPMMSQRHILTASDPLTY